MTLATPAARTTSAEVVERTAQNAGVHIRELDTPESTLRGADVLRSIWGSADTVAPPNLLRALQHSGGYVYGAYDDDGVMVAVSVGFLAAGGLHSHITGVAQRGQRRGLGLAIKQHQRAWSLERGITTISWTCDPLVRRNVAFNLHALGARVHGYLTDFYGPMSDGVNHGDETDRFEIVWDLLSPEAVAAEQGRLPWIVTDAPYAVAEEPDGLPVLDAVGTGSRRVHLPRDIEAVRRADPLVGRAWRLAVRDAVLAGFAAGASITGLTAEGAVVLEVEK